MGAGGIPFRFGNAPAGAAPGAPPSPDVITEGLEDEEGFGVWWNQVANQHRLDQNPDSDANRGINYRMMFAQGLTPEQVPGEAQRLLELERRDTVRPLNEFTQFPDEHPFAELVTQPGRTSNVLLQTSEWDGRTYAIPTMVDGIPLNREQANQKALEHGLERYPQFWSREHAQSWIDENHGNVSANGTVVNRDALPEPGTVERDQATSTQSLIEDYRFRLMSPADQENVLVQSDPRIAALSPSDRDWYMQQLQLKMSGGSEDPIPWIVRPDRLFDEPSALDHPFFRRKVEGAKQAARLQYTSFVNSTATILDTGAQGLEILGYTVKPFVDYMTEANVRAVVANSTPEALAFWQSSPQIRRETRRPTTILEDLEKYIEAGGWQPADTNAVTFLRSIAEDTRAWSESQEPWTGPLSDSAAGRVFAYTNQGVGAMLSIIPQIRIGSRLLGNSSFKYFVGRGAIDGSVDGFRGALDGAVHGAVVDLLFKGGQFIPGRVNKALGTGILFSGLAAYGGAPPADVAAQLFVGIGLGALGIRKHENAVKEQLTAIAAKAEKEATDATLRFNMAQPKDLKPDTFLDPNTGQIGWAFSREPSVHMEQFTSTNRVVEIVMDKEIPIRAAYKQLFDRTSAAIGIPKSHRELGMRIIDGQARSWAENHHRNVDEWYLFNSFTHGIEGGNRHGDLVLESRKKGPPKGSGKGTGKPNPIQLELPPDSEPRSPFEGWRKPKDVIRELTTMLGRPDGAGSPKISRTEHIERLAVRGRLERATGVLPELSGGVEAGRLPEGVRFVNENTIEFTFQKGPNKGKHYVVGAKTPEQWTKLILEHLPNKNDQERAFFWYEDTQPIYRRFFGTEDWLPIATLAYAAQQMKGPVTAFGDMLQVLSQTLGGSTLNREGGLAGPNLTKIIRGEEGNFNAKHHDFADSLRLKNTRSWWANQKSGGGPFVADVHTTRDAGFLDGKIARGSNSGLRRQLTPEQLTVLDRLPLDFKEGPSPGDVQYDYISKWGNRLTRHLNDTKFMDRNDWNPRNAQAVGWVAQQKSVLQRPEFPIDAIIRNTRRVAIELKTDHLPYDATYDLLTRQQQSEVTNRALIEIIPEIFDLIGYPLRATTRSGAGGWQSLINAAGYIDVIGPAWMAEAVGRIVGYTYGQDAVYVSRQVPNGKTFGIRVLEVAADGKMRDDATTAAAVQRLFELDPRTRFGFSREANSEGQHGFNVLFPGKDPSIKKGHPDWEQQKADQATIKEVRAELEADYKRAAKGEEPQGKLAQSIKQVELEFGVDFVVESFRSELKILSNDWKENRGGENNGYLEGLDALTGVSGLREQVVSQLAPKGRASAERISREVGQGTPGRADPFTSGRSEFGVNVARQTIRAVMPNLRRPERNPPTVRGERQGNFIPGGPPPRDPLVNLKTGKNIGPRPLRPGEEAVLQSEFEALKAKAPEPLKSEEGGRVLGQIEIPQSGISIATPAIIRLFEGAHIGTVVHELGHLLRVTMTPEDIRVAEQFYKVKAGVWLPEQEERFAESFEKYLSIGEVSDPKIGPLFAKFANVLRNVYKSAGANMLDMGVLDIGKKAQFERWLSPERARSSDVRGIGREWVLPMTKAEMDWVEQKRPLVDVDRIYDASRHPSPENEVERYADNINLTKIKGEGDIQSVLKILADAVGRESTPLIATETFRDTNKLADELGMTVRQYIGSKGGRIPDAAELTAARSLLQAATRDVVNKAKVAKETQAAMDLVEYERSMIVQRAIKEQLSGDVTRLARAFGSLRQVIGEPGSEKMRAMLEQTIDSFGGSEKMLDSAIRLADLEEAGTAAIRKQVDAELKPTLPGALMEIWIMGLLSGIKTNVRNLISNQAMAMMAPPEAFVSALVGKARTSLGAGAQILMGDRAPSYLTNQERVFFGEAQARVHGYLSGFYGGMKLAGKVIASEDLWNPLTRNQRARNAPVIGRLVDRAARLVESGRDITVDPRIEHLEQMRMKTAEMRVGQVDRRAFGLDPRSENRGSQRVGQLIDDIGEMVRIPGIQLEAGDALYRSIGYMSELSARAYRRAAREDPRGARFLTKAFRQRVAEYTSNPDAETRAASDLNAAYVTFTNPLGPLGKGIMALRRTVPGMRLLVPFMLAPTNLNTRAVERSPIAPIFKNVRKKIKEGGVAGDTALARMTMGSMVLAGFAHMAAQGMVTGDGPTDPALRGGWLDEFQPRSMFFGDSETGLGQWISYDVLEPWGALMGVGSDIGDTDKGKELLSETVAPLVNMLGWTANYAEIVGELQPEDAGELAEIAVQAIMKNFISKSWWRSLDELSRVMTDPDRNFNRWRNAYVRSIVPRIVTHAAQLQDPVWRDAHTLLETLRSQIPGYSKDLAANRNVWGDVLHFGGGLGPDMVSPIFTKNVTGNPLYRAVNDLKLPLRKPHRKIGSIELDTHEYSWLVETGGQPAKAFLMDVVTNKFAVNPRKTGSFTDPSLRIPHISVKLARDQELLWSDMTNLEKKGVIMGVMRLTYHNARELMLIDILQSDPDRVTNPIIKELAREGRDRQRVGLDLNNDDGFYP